MLECLLLIQVHVLVFQILFQIICKYILLWKLFIWNEININHVTISIPSNSKTNDFINVLKVYPCQLII